MAAEVLLLKNCARFKRSNSIELLFYKSATSPSRKTLTPILKRRMQIEHFIKRLEKIQQSKTGFEYRLGKPLQLSDIATIETKLGIVIPEKIKDFYMVANGLMTSNPNFEIIELDLWAVDAGFIHFATFDTVNQVFFNVTELNSAGEWTIVSKYTDYQITLTISSFWTNKIWHWIEKNHKIWKDNWLIN